MKVVFVTNFYNHHQAALAEAFDRQTNHDFVFIETQPMGAERKNMGWFDADVPTYVKKAYVGAQERAECQRLINGANVVIWGSCPFSMIRPRLKQRKLTFCYSERLFKKGFGPIAFSGRAIKYWLRHWRYQKNHYLLCASSFAADDYARIGLFRDKAYKWGYFPEPTLVSDVERLVASKQENSLLWAGRMIDWKHPEIAVEVAYRLKQAGIAFDMNMIGNGDCFASIQEQVQKLNLGDCVHLLGAMPPDQVRRYMEASAIYLFTSDHNEGWGAVVNEAMSSACAVVASDAAGSVQYLIQNKQNGLIYESNNSEQVYCHIVSLLHNRTLRETISKNANWTMNHTWGTETIVHRFVMLTQSLCGDTSLTEYSSGPCSKA